MLALILPLLFASSDAGNNTITDEVFFDIRIAGDRFNDEWEGRFVVGVFGDALPMTTFNFLQLAKGFKHRYEKWHYKGARVHRIFPDSIIQTGDVILKDGRSGRAIYAPYFIDEDFIHSHRSAGYVGMVSSGVDMNGSQFYITLTKARWLDNKSVLFGKIVTGMETVRKIAEVPTNMWQYPERDIEITDCGMLSLDKPYDLSEPQLNSEADAKQVKPTAPQDKKALEL